MAPMVRGDTVEFLDDCLDIFVFNLDEISSLATNEDLFHHTKLMEDNVIDVSLQPTVVLQPASPQSQSQLVDQEFFIDPAAPVPQQALNPEPSNIQGQPANPLFQPQPVDQEYFIHPDTHPASPEFLILQSATPDPFLQQAQSPAPIHEQPFPEAASSNFLVLQPAIVDLSPEPSNIKVQPASPQKFDLLQLSSSLESMASSPADSMLASVSVWQEEEAASPAPQQVGDAPKKRGRKRKYPEGVAPSRRRPRKPKIYEMGPFPDSEMEKKRKNAVNAKRHRDMQKEEKNKLSNELAQATAERDRLLQVVNQYKQREQQLLQRLSVHGIKIDGLNHTPEGF